MRRLFPNHRPASKPQRTRLAAAVFLAGMAACYPHDTGRIAPGGPTANSGAETEVVEQYMSTIGPGDEIELGVLGEPELSKKFQVFSDGTITVPLIGKINVGGLDPNQVGEIVAARLRNGFILDPQVTVFIAEKRSQKVFVLGEVKEPGAFPYDDNMTVVHAIALAGGFTELAAQNDTSVTRRVKGQERRILVPVTEIVTGRRKNFRLRPGDMVFVPQSIF